MLEQLQVPECLRIAALLQAGRRLGGKDLQQRQPPQHCYLVQLCQQQLQWALEPAQHMLHACMCHAQMRSCGV